MDQFNDGLLAFAMSHDINQTCAQRLRRDVSEETAAGNHARADAF
jgi:hypothetical protein